jgi:hypothetical protein
MPAFDGSTSYLRRQGRWPGVSSSKKVTGSLWVYRDGTSNETIFNALDASSNVIFSIAFVSSELTITGANAAGAEILNLKADTALGASSWQHYVFSVDLATAAGEMYKNRADDTKAGATLTDDTIAFANIVDTYIGSDGSSSFLDGSLYDLLLWPGQQQALSTETNLLQFVSSDGFTYTGSLTNGEYANPGPTAGTPKPVGYGPGASRPFGGLRPAILFSGSFVDNKGTGGSFSLNGTLDLDRGPASYRQSPVYPTPGERWFDSDRSGFSFPRSETFIERREGHPQVGARMGLPEQDEPFREERGALDLSNLILGYGWEEDQSDDDQLRSW